MITQRVFPGRIYLIFIALNWCFYPGAAQNDSLAKIGQRYWLVEMSIENSVYSKLKRNKKETSFTPGSFTLNGETLQVKEMHTRGKTTQHFWRKSYTVALKDRIGFSEAGVDHHLDHFYLISMSLDRNYYHNKLAFHCLSLLDLFPLYHHYVEVRINGISEGLYLLVQRPADYALEELGSPGILRRGSTDFIAKEKFGESASEENRLECKRIFKEIKSPGSRYGEGLYQYLNERIDLKAYFYWLAFNYLMRNGDYTDEVFYYVLPDQSPARFGIIPWDFDDILVKDPHEGKEVRDRQLGDQLIFSSEDKLDRLIARDPYLYKQYLIQFDKVMQVLDSESLTHIFREIENDLAPYFTTNSVVDASKHDFRPVENWQALKDNMASNLGYLKSRVVIVRQMSIQSRTAIGQE